MATSQTMSNGIHGNQISNQISLRACMVEWKIYTIIIQLTNVQQVYGAID